MGFSPTSAPTYGTFQNPPPKADMTTSAPVPKDSPLMIEWEKFAASEEYLNALKWAAFEAHREGSLWAAFMAGFNAAQPSALASRVLAMCQKRDWCLHWTSRGAYLHLESSELIEAIRGKGTSTPKEEAGDVLLVLMSITEAAGISFDQVIAEATAKCAKLETLPRYEGEEVKPSERRVA